MEKRKNGIYVDRYIVEGNDFQGREINFHIYNEQANTFAKAIKFWEENWGRNHKAILIRHSKPLSNLHCYAA